MKEYKANTICFFKKIFFLAVRRSVHFSSISAQLCQARRELRSLAGSEMDWALHHYVPVKRVVHPLTSLPFIFSINPAQRY